MQGLYVHIDAQVKKELKGNIQNNREIRMVLDQAQARELGEALIDASDKIDSNKNTQAIVVVGDLAVAVPYHPDMQDEYETVCIIGV